MPGPAAVLNILITANATAAQANIAKTEAQMKSLAATSNSSAMATAGAWQKAGQRMSSIGRTMTRTISLPAAAVGAVSVKMAMDFDESMMKIQNLAGASTSRMKEFRQEVLALAPSVGKSPQELAEALYFIRSSGIKAADSMEVLKRTAMASAIGLGETKTVADAVTSAMNAYRRSNLTAAQATNILAKTVQKGKGEPEELAASIGRVIPVASKLKVPFSDVGASLAGLTLQGLDAAEATTALRAVFLAVLKPGSQAAEQLASVGLSSEGLRKTLRERGTLAMLTQLSTAFKGNEEAMARVFPNVRGLVGAYNLTGDSAKRNAQIFQEMKDKTDIVAIGFQRLSQSEAFKMRQALADLQATAIKLGETLLPIVAKLTDAFAGLFSIVQKIPGASELLVGAIIIGPLVRMIGLIVQATAAWRAYQIAAAGAAATQAGAGAVAAGGAAAGAGGAAATAGKVGLGAGLTAAAKTYGKGIGIGIIGAADLYVATHFNEIGNKIDPAKAFAPAAAGVREKFALTVNQALDSVSGSVMGFVGRNKVAVATQFGELIFNVKTQQVVAAKSDALKKFVGMNLSQVSGALAHWQAPGGVNAAKMFVDSIHFMERVAKDALPRIAKSAQFHMAKYRQAIQSGKDPVPAFKASIWGIAETIDKALQKGEINAKQWMIRITNLLAGYLRAVGATVPADFPRLGQIPGAAPTPGKIKGTAKALNKRRGGRLPGPMAGDTIPLLAEGGEFMVNAKATKKFLPLLAAINDGTPRFAQGGKIPSFRGQSPGALDDFIAGGLNLYSAGARSYLAKKRAAMGGRGGMGGGSATWRAIDALAAQWGLNISSGFRPGSITSSGNLSFHAQRGPGGRSRATDYADSPHAMLIFARKMSKRYGHSLAELIHTPLGYSIKNGARTAPIAAADHFSHVHVAMQRGGIVGNWNKNQLTTLAAYAGMKNPAMMAAIAMAESGGNPRSTGGAGERGLWQILGSTAASFGLPWGKMYDPIKNARGAAKILKGQGLGAWTTYTSGAYKRFLGGQVKPGLLARLKGGAGGAGAAGTTAKVAKETTYGLLGTIDRDALLESMQAAVEAENARRGTINELQAAQNLLALQRYQTGAAQNPFLGIPSPAMPVLAQMLGMAPNAFLHAFPEPPVRSGKMRKGYGFGAGIVGQAQPPPVHVHIHAKKGAPDFTSWLDVQIEKKQKKAARLGRRRLPSAGAR